MRLMRQIFILLLINTLLFSCKNDSMKFSEIRPPYKSLSPAVKRWLAMDSSTLKTDLNKFWEINPHLPLVEKDSLYDDYVFITFLYHNELPNKEIKFEMFGIYEEYRFADMKLYPLSNTGTYYRSYMIPNDLCFSYRFSVRDTISGEIMKVVDKYNSNTIPRDSIFGYSFSAMDLRTSEPDYNSKRENVGHGKLDTLIFNSKILGYNKDIFVYTPVGFDKNRKQDYPVLYLFDSFIYLNRVEVPNILDNLINEEKIEPMIAVLINNYSDERRETELHLSYEFKSFVTDELVSYIRTNYNGTTNPQQTIIGGISLGGLASTFMSFYHPDIFGKVLSQSGAFWRDTCLVDNYDNEIRNDWLINQFLLSDKKPIKIFMDWGLQENMVLGSNRKMARVLKQKGYDFTYIEFNGWHDWANSRKTFPNGLIYLLN